MLPEAVINPHAGPIPSPPLPKATVFSGRYAAAKVPSSTLPILPFAGTVILLTFLNLKFNCTISPQTAAPRKVSPEGE